MEQCYTNSLQWAIKYHCESIAFPLLAAGNQGFPKDIALQTAVNAFSKFLMKHEIRIYLVVFDKSSFALSEKLFSSVQSFIDETYVQEIIQEEYRSDDEGDARNSGSIRFRGAAIRREESEPESIFMACDLSPDSFTRPAPSRKLEDLMAEIEETFSECLIHWIDKKGLKDPDVYKKANIDRKLFSKIKNNKGYRPSKSTAIAFAIALELNLDETRDLIGRAGYAMTHSNKFDIIIEYFLTEKNYDIFEINEVLFAFEQPLIGA